MATLRKPKLPHAARQPQAVLPPGHGDALHLLEQVVERPLWIYDFERGGMDWANRAGLRFWRCDTLETLRARDFSPTSHGIAARLDNLRRGLADGSMQAQEWTFYPGGKPVRRTCRLSGVVLADGRMALLVDAGAEDLAGVPRTPAASGHELRAVEAVRQTPLMISMATETGQWLMHNPSAEGLVQALGTGNLPGFDNFAALFAQPQEAIALRDRALDTGHAEATLRMAGKAFRMHEVALRRLSDPVTGRRSVMVSQQDVTRAFRADRRLQKALLREKAIAETQRMFLSVTSHDFRTPLSIIDSAARRIARKAEPDSEIAERAGTIRATARRMAEAIERTLGWTSIAEGKVAFQPEVLPLRPLAEKAVAGHAALHPARRFEITFDDVPPVAIDAGLVERMLDNLLSNAVKYSPASGGAITVRCSTSGRHVDLSVSDGGIGIPAADMPRLFSRFFRSSNAAGTKGSGIGLSAVQFYMKLHGGKVLVDSIEGQGATFTLRFPIKVRGQAPAAG